MSTKRNEPKTHLSIHTDVSQEGHVGKTYTFCGRLMALDNPKLRVPQGMAWTYPIAETDEVVIWREQSYYDLEFPIQHEESVCRNCVDIYNHRVEEGR